MAFVLGTELGIDFKHEIVDVYTSEFLDRFNPLRQIPTLVIDEEQAIFDSRAIFAYFRDVSSNESIVPESDHAHDTRVCLFLGLTDACLQYRMESIRPHGERSQVFMDKQAARMDRCFTHVESIASRITSGGLRLEQIVAACALEYVEYRYSGKWRRTCPRIETWLSEFSMRNSMTESRPSER